MGEQELVEKIDYGLIIASGVFSLVAAFGAFYAWPWSWCRAGRPVIEYNSVWGVRVCLQLTAFFWLLSPLLQLHESWTTRVDVLERTELSGSLPCQVYLAARLGLFEPFFLFLGLLVLRHSLRQGRGWEAMSMVESGRAPAPTKHVNLRIIGRALLNTLPIFGLQAALALFTLVLEDDNYQSRTWLDMLLLSHSTEKDRCPNLTVDEVSSDIGCVACLFPLASTVVSGLVVMYYLYCLWETTSEMMRITVNRSLTHRMTVFRFVVTTVLLFGILCRGCSVAVEPLTVYYEFLRLGDFVSVVLFVVAASYSLVLRPVHDSRYAEKMNNCNSRFWREVGLNESLKSIGTF